MERQNKTKEWADENVVLELSEKMVAFNQATQLALEKGNKGQRKIWSEKKKNRIPKSKQNNRDGSQTFLKCSVSLDNPPALKVEALEENGLAIWSIMTRLLIIVVISSGTKGYMI